jgi:ribonuclease BN (tRNA processing enzyme)
MLVKCIGCGNAFSTRNFNQQFLLEEYDQIATPNGAVNSSTVKRMLIDCGWTTPLSLKASDINIKSIDDIYISHAHADHCGGLEYVAFMRYDWKNRPEHHGNTDYAPRLIANEHLMKDLWDKSLSGGLESMEGFVATMETYFKLLPIRPNQPFNWQGWKCELIQQVHIMTGSSVASTYGLFMSKSGHKSVYFTTDSQHCSPKQMEIFYKKADIIFQDCECLGCNMKDRGFLFGSGVHANYAQLAGWENANAVKLSPEIKKKMHLSHYQDFVSDNKDAFGNDVDWDDCAKEEGFAGFVWVGKEFEV